MIIAKGFGRLITKGLAGACDADTVTLAEVLEVAVESEERIAATLETTQGVSARIEPVGSIAAAITEAEEVGAAVAPVEAIAEDLDGAVVEVVTEEGVDVGGWIYISDVTVPGGTATGKIWQDASETVLQEVTVSSLTIEVEVRASYPLVTVGGSPFTLPRDAGGGYYSDTVSVALSAEGSFVAQLTSPDDEEGPDDTCVVTLVAPPNITALSFTGGYPGSQTELKEDDNFGIAVTADRQFDRVRILDYEACKLEEFVVGATYSTTVSATIDDEGDTVVARPARVQVRDASTGAWSSTRDTDQGGGSVDGTDVVNCNNLYPSVAWGSPSYPGAQQALKNSEQATLTLTASDYDTIPVDSPNAQLTIIDGTPPGITVERLAGDYNVSTDNLRATANRAANDATTVAQTVVAIAHVAATLDATFATRLRSGGNDGTSAQNHTITVDADQLLASFDMDEDTGGGTFLGSWSGTPPDASWTRSLQVHDDDTKGTYSWQNVLGTNLAGITTTSLNTGGSYVLGGFVARDVTWQAFQTVSDSVNVAISDYSKVQAGLWQATSAQSIKKPIGSTPSYDAADDNAYCASASGANPHTVTWLDQDAAESNSGTADLFDYEEVV